MSRSGSRVSFMQGIYPPRLRQRETVHEEDIRTQLAKERPRYMRQQPGRDAIGEHAMRAGGHRAAVGRAVNTGINNREGAAARAATVCQLPPYLSGLSRTS